MPKFKVALSFLLYITSCVSLLLTPAYVSMALTVYSAEFVASHGPRIPAFSAAALSVMPNAWSICLAVLGASVLLAVLAFWRSDSRDVKLYWLGVLANVNLYVAFLLFGIVLVGFFLLPRVVNGI
jgi:hypothetical protein